MSQPDQFTDPLTHWLHGGSCPTWCAGGCTYDAEPTDPVTYSRVHYSPDLAHDGTAVAGASPAAVHLVQAEETNDPAASDTEREPVGVLVLCRPDTYLGAPEDARKQLLSMAHGFTLAADALAKTIEGGN